MYTNADAKNMSFIILVFFKLRNRVLWLKLRQEILIPINSQTGQIERQKSKNQVQVRTQESGVQSFWPL